MVRLELAGGPTNLKNRDLKRMYEDGSAFNSSGAEAVRRTLDLLRKVFPNKAPELTRFTSIALYAVVAELLSAYVREEFEPHLQGWFIDFERRRREEDKLSEDETVPEWIQWPDSPRIGMRVDQNTHRVIVRLPYGEFLGDTPKLSQ